MTINTALIGQNAAIASNSSKAKNAASGAGFAQLMAKANETSTENAAEVNKNKTYTSGQLSVELNEKGQPFRVQYFDKDGGLLTKSGFGADHIVRLADKFGIDKADLKGIADQMDKDKVGYKPYELYPGTGSDHGIDLYDLADGGLGTAYDWTKDSKAAQRGLHAESRLAANVAMVEKLNIVKNESVTNQVIPETPDYPTHDPDGTEITHQAVKFIPGAMGKSDYAAGQIGVELNKHGVPFRVNYFDEDGNKLTSSGFSADHILKFTEKFGIDKAALHDLAAKMDKDKVGYKPYELYPDTGSNHGIDLNDLADGGLGTVYDWRIDEKAANKGLHAERRLADTITMAERLNVVNSMEAKTKAGGDILTKDEVQVFANFAYKSILRA